MYFYINFMNDGNVMSTILFYIQPSGRQSETNKQKSKQKTTDRQTGRQAGRQTDRQAGGQTDRG